MKHTFLPGRRNTLEQKGWPYRSTEKALMAPTAARPGTRTYAENGVAPAVEAELLLDAPAQDPQVVYADGGYHYCESSAAGVFIRSAEELSGLREVEPLCIWSPARRGPCSQNIWAPELHFLDGRWYVYFAADDGKNENHRMFVLVSEGRNVRGPYSLAGSLETEGWAIDGTVFTANDGERYFIWSGWPGKKDGQQNLYISRMASPTELAGERVLLTVPSRAWERNGMAICEGPQVLRRGRRTFVVYSASASWTGDYCLGMLAHEAGDVMNPANWRKVGQVFSRNDYACGVGHCGFVTKPNGEHWIIYHAKTKQRPGWLDREVRAQRFYWNIDGTPRFGEPGQCRRRIRTLARAA